MQSDSVNLATDAGADVFARVVVGVDGSEPGFEAVRQARRLVAPGGRLELLTAVHLAEATRAGWSAPRLAAELEAEAADAMRRAGEIAGAGALARVLDGAPLECLLAELERTEATLAVVGTHGHRRISEILLGGVAGPLLHRARCSVLVARPARAWELFPHSVVAGTDGSKEGEAAVVAARALAARFEVPLRVVTAVEGDGAPLRSDVSAGSVETIEAEPVTGLVAVSAEADVLVVGSRGLHGVKALGSVSERVAHRAACSVLVVRARGC